MRITIAAALAGAGLLAACSGSEPPPPPPDPPELALTPGSWAANDEGAAFADQSGAVRVRLRCDAEARELVLETPGAFAEGTRPAMMLTVGRAHHGIEGVEQRGGGDPARIARIPVVGPVSAAIIGSNEPMTIETEGAPALMAPTDDALKGFIAACAGDTSVAAPAPAPAGDAVLP